MDPDALPSHLHELSADVEIWPEHEGVVSLFALISGQWRVAGETVLALDYGVLPSVTSLLGIEYTLELLYDVRTMESRALEILNEPKKEKKNKTRRKR